MLIGMYCVIRTRSAGVHMGIVRQIAGTAVLLAGDNYKSRVCKPGDGSPRKLWRWEGANTTYEVSQNGVNDRSRISEPVPMILLTEAIEVIPCSDVGRKSLERSNWPAD